jgi:hypothetical protein
MDPNAWHEQSLDLLCKRRERLSFVAILLVQEALVNRRPSRERQRSAILLDALRTRSAESDLHLVEQAKG